VCCSLYCIWLSSISHIVNSLKLKSIVYHHTKLCLLTFYKIVNHLVELPIPSYITRSTRYSQGNQDKYIKPSATVDANRFSFYPRSITLWNQLPINDILSLNDFDDILQSTLKADLKTLFYTKIFEFLQVYNTLSAHRHWIDFSVIAYYLSLGYFELDFEWVTWI